MNVGLACSHPVVGETLVACSVDESDQGRDLTGDGDTFDRDVLHIYDVENGHTRNLSLVAVGVELQGRLAAFHVSEVDQGVDLDGDGAIAGLALHVYDAATGVVTNFGVWAGVEFAEGVMLVSVLEIGTDLNGDGDDADSILHVYDLTTRVLRNLELAARFPRWSAGGRIAFTVHEDAQGADLNGDGDEDDPLLFLYEPMSGAIENTGVACEIGDFSGRFVLCAVFEYNAGDLNGDGEANDQLWALYDLGGGTPRRLLVGAVSSVAYAVWERGIVAIRDDPDPRDDVPGSLLLYDVSREEIRDLGLFCDRFERAGRLLLCSVPERQQDRDLNGDGDLDDSLLHVFDSESLVMSNLRLPAHPFAIRVGGPLVVSGVDETALGRDMNGDGDAGDRGVLELWDARVGLVESLALNIPHSSAELLGLDGDRIAVPAEEVAQGNRDRNGDGDAADVVLHVHDARSGRTRNLGLACSNPGLRGDVLACGVSEASQHGVDLNGDGDVADAVLHVYDLADGDADELSDSDERALGTRLDATDSDGDGLLDDEEVALEVDPTSPDSDADGVPDGSDLDLVRRAIDRLSAPAPRVDEDRDGLSDADEISFRTRPDLSDSDGDGLGDGEDPDTWVSVLERFPGVPFFREPDARYRARMLAALSEAEARLAAGNVRGALATYLRIRGRMDGCMRLWSEAPDRDDWIGECSHSRQLLHRPFELLTAAPARRAIVGVLGRLHPARPAPGPLVALRRRFDGCGGPSPQPDADDWAPCSDQAELRAALDPLVRNLRTAR